MAVAQKVGRGMKTLAQAHLPAASSLYWTLLHAGKERRQECRRGRQECLRHPPMRVLALLMLAAVSAPAATFYLTIAGLGGEPDYAQRFKMWAEDIDGSLKKSGGDVNVTTLQSPTREQIRAKLGAIAGQAKATDALVVILRSE